jgi:small subunit ribosomal protein S7
MADEEKKQPETSQDLPSEPSAPEAPAEAQKADSPDISADKPVEERPEEAVKPAREPAEAKPKAAPSPLSDVLLFGKFDTSEVVIQDAGIARYVDVSPVAVPHTGGKHSSRAFGKAKMSIVERLINGMMRTEDFTGKKIKSYKAVEDAFMLIHEKTNRNPVQTFVDALQNAAPREEVTRLQYGGISVPKAVDVAPARRVDLALRNICKGALESSHKSKKPIGECLADEIIAAAKGDVNCHSVSKKEEIERVSASAR